MPSNTIEQKIFLIFSGVLSGILILLLTLCLISPFLFILLRVLMLWVLLFSSPLAWAGYAIPGSTVFRQWWNLFIGWNAFGPVYLFVLIPGMIILSRSGDMLTALGNSAASGTTLGTASGLFQIFMFSAFAVLVFLGGLAVAMKSSFAGAVKGTAVLGDVAGKFGAFDTSGLAGARLAGRGLAAAGRATGVSATIQARREQLAQGAGELRRRYIPQLPFKSYEERLASERARLGVIGGAAEQAKLQSAPIEAERLRMASAMSGMEKSDKATYLKARMNSADKRVALAAREEMLKMGLLDDAEKLKTANMYGVPGSAARRAFEDRTKTTAGAAIREKKKEAEEKKENLMAQVEASDLSQPAAVAALLDPYQGANLTPDQRSEKRAIEEAIGKKDPAKLLDYMTAGGGATPDDYRRAFEPVLKDKGTLVKLDPKYFDSAANTQEFRNLKAAINTRYTPGAAVGSSDYQAREKFKDDLINARPSMQAQIEDLFT